MNFQRLWENMNLSKEKEQPLEDQAMAVIRSGLNLNDNFWKEFMLVINNSDGISQLLDVPVEKIMTWRKNIEKGLDQIEKKDQHGEVQKNKKLMKTGIPEIQG
jgi:hypothetical protein